MSRLRVVYAAAGYALLLAALVLTPIGSVLNRLTVRMYVVWHYDCTARWVLPEHFGMLLNVLMFVPVGVLISLLLRRSWWLSTLTCALLSTAIELAQWVLPLDRMASVDDVVTNTIGGLLGVLSVVWARRRRTSVSTTVTPDRARA